MLLFLFLTAGYRTAFLHQYTKLKEPLRCPPSTQVFITVLQAPHSPAVEVEHLEDFCVLIFPPFFFLENSEAN